VTRAVVQPTRSDLERFVSDHYPRVVATVGMITGDRQNAADAVQDALVGYLAKPPARAIENLPAWITAVASNRLRDAHRTRAAESRAVAKAGVTPEAVEDATEMLDIDLQRALDRLPARQRRICALHYLLDLSVDDVASAMGISAGTVKTQLFRARATLAAALGHTVVDEVSA
jgi:RNA polymerase sigma factor (sigma-70 family)